MTKQDVARASGSSSHGDRSLNEAVRNARIKARMTQAQLATKIGTTQSAIARLETGRAEPRVETLERLANVLNFSFEIVPRHGVSGRTPRMRPATLTKLRANRDDILRLARERGAANVRVFGSVARGDADSASDVDLLVDIVSDVKGLAYFALLEDLRRDFRDLLGCEVDVVDAAALDKMQERVLQEALPL